MDLRKEIEDFYPKTGLGFSRKSSGYEAYKRIARHFYQLGKESRR